MCSFQPAARPGKGSGEGKGADPSDWLVPCRSHQFFDFLVWLSHMKLPGEMRPLSVLLRLRQSLSCFFPQEGDCTWFKDSGRAQAIWIAMVPQSGNSLLWALSPQQPVQKSSLLKLSSVPQKHRTNPCCLHTWEVTETQNPISLKSCSVSHTASPSDRVVKLQREWCIRIPVWSGRQGWL